MEGVLGLKAAVTVPLTDRDYQRWCLQSGDTRIIGPLAGSPEGVYVANRGTLYLRSDGGATTTLYVKTADDGLATGWTSK